MPVHFALSLPGWGSWAGVGQDGLKPRDSAVREVGRPSGWLLYPCGLVVARVEAYPFG